MHLCSLAASTTSTVLNYLFTRQVESISIYVIIVSFRFDCKGRWGEKRLQDYTNLDVNSMAYLIRSDPTYKTWLNVEFFAYFIYVDSGKEYLST